MEGLFALADELELRLAKARGQVDRLTPSLLARVFAGQLVPQDPNDKPASALLEGIRKARPRIARIRISPIKTRRENLWNQWFPCGGKLATLPGIEPGLPP